MLLCVTEPDFFKNGSKVDQKLGFLDLLENLVIFFLTLVCKESSYYLLYSCTNPILGKNLVPEILAKMFSASQIAGFLN